MAGLFAGAVQLNEAAMQQLQQQGYDRDLVLESLLAGDCNAATAAYHLMQQAVAMRQAAYSSMQPSQQPGNYEVDTDIQGKRIDTPMRILSRPQSGPAGGILAYRPNQVGLEVAGAAAGGEKRQKQHVGHVGDDSAEALHQSAALHATTQC